MHLRRKLTALFVDSCACYVLGITAALPSADLQPEASFLPPAADSQPAHQPFRGTVILAETSMATTPAQLHSTVPLKADPLLFPGVRLKFYSIDGDLVPTTEGVQRIGSVGRGRTFWDLLVQPGQVWSIPGEGSWSRAAFPFALVNSFENETHNGIATFRYRGHEITAVHFQISVETAPYLIETPFTARGEVPARLETSGGPAPFALLRDHRLAKRDAIPIADWGALSARLGHPAPILDTGVPPSKLVIDGIDYQGTFYIRKCAGVAGPLAWCDRRRFGVWSATKSLANSAALLRLAQKYGAQVFDARIADYVPEARASAGWAKVRFADAIGMATGVGLGSSSAAPDAIMDGSEDPTYMSWYLARSAHEKLNALVSAARVMPWGPGKVARYRDQDMFMLGVAMDRYLKSREGNTADIWSMLEREVYEPIGIQVAPVNRTLESDPASLGEPLMAFGYYPTIGDVVKIARLYQNHGEWAGQQILYRPRIDQILDGTRAYGLPAGHTRDGPEIDYFNSFWRHPYLIAPGCLQYVPEMVGYGRVTVSLMPGLTAIRIARETEEGDEYDGLMPAATLSGFCRSQERETTAN